ncbi:MAG: site-specific DNA-methyltransferase [Deltaproteobacteria bacterium]|nr:site-specific DNA-methyltransferase [Deltaproteobacteria bacterium]
MSEASARKKITAATRIPNYERLALHSRYSSKLITNPELTRALVSFQANKNSPFYRWLKYKEAFSSDFVKYILQKFPTIANSPPRVLDPFAGVGTTLTIAVRMGCKAIGIELLPVGTTAIRARLIAEKVNLKSFEYYLKKLEELPFDTHRSNGYQFPHLRITKNAFPKQTEKAFSAYSAFLEEIDRDDVRSLFFFAWLSILEEVSYTRKDGQYLRWDFRSNRRLESKFNKGTIPDLRSSILNKLYLMHEDIKRRKKRIDFRKMKIIDGSCLTELPKLPDASIDLIITSPPYCNRYDYTRTYALELAFLGYTDDGIKKLRQTLLSATVENKTKRKQLAEEYNSMNRMNHYNSALNTFYNQKALQEILNLLNTAREKRRLNNNNIPNMVENYFFEMNLVIQELGRILAPNGHVIMVNDNVQYYGEEIPVDLILSDFATSAGLSVEMIWVLQKGKGNSSQQMGNHGRNELRKCTYIWSK